MFLTSVFPILISTAARVHGFEPLLIEGARRFCATRREIITKVMRPAAPPSNLTASRLAIARGIVGTVVDALFDAWAGLGHLILS